MQAESHPILWTLFTTREWAIGIWLIIGLIWATVVTHKAVLGFLKAAFNRHFVRTALVFVTYFVAAILVFQQFGLWQQSQLKTTLLWALFAAPPMVAHMIIKEVKPELLKAWLKDAVGAAIIVELVVNFHTFPIWVELLLVPVLAFVGMLLAVAGKNPEHRPIAAFLNSILGVFGIYVLGRGLWLIVTNWADFATLETLRDFYTAPLLSMTALPFLYFFYLYVRFETAFSSLAWPIPDPKLRDYAKAMAIIRFNTRIPLLKRWRREVGRVRPTTRRAVVESMNAVFRAHARALNPPPVDPKVGWCPIAAGKYLESEHFIPGDYHKTHNDVWRADAPFQRPASDPSSYSTHTIGYAIEGDEDAAHALTLQLFASGLQNPTEAEAHFQRAGSLLLERAVPTADVEVAARLFQKRRPFEYKGETTIALEREDFSVKAFKSYELRLVLTRRAKTTSEALRPIETRNG